ncbi:nucleoside diphosphate kinase [Gleimia coleocanis DSM 15436]|uniref:Nucleoside diphosphate kinase n=1 Tax=Gleimia coleocanis DSM 15436 TaxID=525245 RepID=C0W170_9ACTO|nr:nucleoside-diphosphate kinase [Gleimia coleocanis]EEH63559.1 nucleoside diphosphate kinase [Gleimia coleocanis DSM 15436]
MSRPFFDETRQHTLIVVKPDGYARGLTGEVIRRIERKGYKVVALKLMQASKELLTAHYTELVERPFFPDIVEYMTSGPVVAMVVEGDRVIEGMRVIMGPTDPTVAPAGTIRGDLGRDWNSGNIENIVHGSDCPENAEREIGLWFPELTA